MGPTHLETSPFSQLAEADTFINRTTAINASQVVISRRVKQPRDVWFSYVPLIQLSQTSWPCKVFSLRMAHNVDILRRLNDIMSGLNCPAAGFYLVVVWHSLCITME